MELYSVLTETRDLTRWIDELQKKIDKYDSEKARFLYDQMKEGKRPAEAIRTPYYNYIICRQKQERLRAKYIDNCKRIYNSYTHSCNHVEHEFINLYYINSLSLTECSRRLEISTYKLNELKNKYDIEPIII